MRDDEFELDDSKAAKNFAKHKITFDLVRLAFDDLDWIDEIDPDPDEDRYNRLCMHAGRVFVITYVDRGTRIRIVSVRKATRHEQRTYFAARA